LTASPKVQSAALHRSFLRCGVALLRITWKARRAWHLELFAVLWLRMPGTGLEMAYRLCGVALFMPRGYRVIP